MKKESTLRFSYQLVSVCKIFVLFAIAGFSLLVYSFPVQALQPAFIKGAVFSSYDNSLIRTASVATNTGLTATAPSGQFFIRVPPNLYTLIVTSLDYKANMLAGVLAAPGQTTTVNFWLIPASTDTAVLEGRIRELGTGKAIQGAFIATDLGGVAFSDENGYFSMISPTGIATVTVAATDFATKISKNVPILINSQNSEMIYLTKSSDMTISVTGSITNACTGATIGNARIFSQTGDETYSTGGHYSLTVPPGLTTIVATAHNFQFLYKTVSLTPLPTSRIIDLELFPSEQGTGLLQGVVTNAFTGEPVEDAEFVTDTGAISFSAADGTYLLYTSICSSIVYVSKEGFQEQQIEVSLSSIDPLTLDIALEPLGTISGVVTDNFDNHTIQGALLFLQEQPDISAATRDDGSYTLGNISPGPYTVSASHQCYLAQQQETSVALGDQLVHDFQLEPVGNGLLQGFVLDSITGDPIALAQISADHGAEVSSDETGFYTLSLPACQTQLTVKADGYLTPPAQSIFIQEGDVTELNIELTPCPFNIALADAAAPQAARTVLDTLRKYRDTVLLQDEMFKKYVTVFYDHARFLAAAITQNHELKILVQDIITGIYEILSRCSFREPAVDATLVEQINAVLDNIAQQPIPENLKKSIHRLQGSIQNGEIINRMHISVKR